MLVPLLNDWLMAAVVPNMTVAAGVNPVPVIVSAVDPLVGPEVTEREVTVGKLVLVYWSAITMALRPMPFVTWMSTIPPGVAAGMVGLSEESVATVKLALTPPTVTAVAPVKLVPVTVTVPPVPPLFGPTAVTVGMLVGV